MELTSRHKAYLVVLGLAGLALGVDRFLLSGEGTSPSKASATPTEAVAAEAHTDAASTPTSAPPANAKPTLATRMSELTAAMGDSNATPSAVGNAFVPEWELTPRTSAAAPEPAASKPMGNWLRLSSVVPGRAAVINGTVVFVGKEHAVPADPDDRSARTGGGDGRRVMRKITLVRAEERRVVVRVGEDEIELSLLDRSELQRPRSLEDAGIVVTPADSGDR